MKKLKVKKGSTCMACLACVGACSEAFYKVFDPDRPRHIYRTADRRSGGQPFSLRSAEPCEMEDGRKIASRKIIANSGNIVEKKYQKW